MANDYYFRQWSLSWDNKVIIEATDAQDFKVTFKILHDANGYVSYCDLSLFNLSEATMNKLSKRNKTISLSAGYLGLHGTIDSSPYVGEIFKGRVVNFIKEKQTNNIVFRIFATGTGILETEPTIHKTLGENTNIVAILTELAKGLGTGIQINKEVFEADPRYQYPRGYVLNGGVRSILRKLANSHNFFWAIQDDDLVVTKDKQPTSTETNVPVVSLETGMEGIPEITEAGCTVTTRLRPDFKIGKSFLIESSFKTVNFSQIYYQDLSVNQVTGKKEEVGTGKYLLNQIEHTGDSYGNAWNTKLTGIIS